MGAGARWGALAATGAAAELSHRLVEQPFRTAAVPDRAFVPAAVATFAAVAALAVALPPAEAPSWAARPIAATRDEPPDATRDATRDAPPAEPIPLLVWGDATAAPLAERLAADPRFAITSQVDPGCAGAGSCPAAAPVVPAGELAAVVVAIDDPAPFHTPSTNALDLYAPERQAGELWDRLSRAAGGRPVVLAMSPGARRELGVGLHLRRMAGDDAANLVLDAEADRWPDAIADRFTRGAEGPRRVLVVGDSVAYSLATDFRPRGTVVWDQSRHGCDPSPGDRVTARNGRDRSPPVCDWRAAWARAVDTWDPDVVVWHTGTWSTYDRVVDGDELAVGDPAWRQAVAGAHAEALDILGARGARVVVAVVAPAWETAPTTPVETRPEESARRMPELLAAVRSAAAGRDGVTVLDASEVVCDPTCDRPDLRGDGVHYTPEGARVVGEWLSARLPQAR